MSGRVSAASPSATAGDAIRALTEHTATLNTSGGLLRSQNPLKARIILHFGFFSRQVLSSDGNGTASPGPVPVSDRLCCIKHQCLPKRAALMR